MADDDITSAELDDLLDEAETIYVGRPDGPTEMRLFVAVDPETFRVLEQRAAKAGTVVTAAASEALRRGARVA